MPPFSLSLRGVQHHFVHKMVLDDEAIQSFLGAEILDCRVAPP